MAGPIDAVMAIHNAFRADMAGIDAAALAAARGTPGLEATVERFRFFNEVLVWHAHGEELAIFPGARSGRAVGRRGVRDGPPRPRSRVRHVEQCGLGARRVGDGACDGRVQVPSRHSPRQGRRALVPHHQGAGLGARPGQGGRRHGRRSSPGPQPGVHRVDVPAARRRRPREHDPHLADGDAAGSLRRSHRSSSTRRSATTSPS